MSCPFCERIDRLDYEQSYAGEAVVRFEPLDPVTPGHMLFVPGHHITHASSVANIYIGTAMSYAAKYARERGEDFNLITSSGDAATQTIPHVHIHYVPRRPDDKLPLPWTLQQRKAHWKNVPPLRKQVDRAIGGVLFNSMNHPDPVAVMGQDFSKLRTLCVEAVMGVLKPTPDTPAEVVCICGSTRFRAQMIEANRRLTMNGAIVLAPEVFGHDGDPLTDDDKERLDDLHFRKIDMADSVVVIAPGGYIGTSTSREIAYAKGQGKPVKVWDWPPFVPPVEDHGSQRNSYPIGDHASQRDGYQPPHNRVLRRDDE